MMNITFRASNPDNIFDIKGIIDLFVATYDFSFPNRKVYQENFWRERIGNRFISIVAERDSKIVGHLACCPHKNDNKNVQIIMPVVIPCPEEEEILMSLWSLVERIAKKKHWKMAYKFITSYPEKMESVISTIGNFNETAIYPGHRTTNELLDIKTETAYPILYSQHIFDTSLLKNEIVYVPNEYKELAENLYNRSNLPRVFCDLDNKIARIYTDVKPVEIKSYKHTGLCRAYITPSLLNNYSKEALLYDETRFCDMLLYVSLFDPECPSFCKFLESLGYSFSGIIPLIDGGDHIIYSKDLSNLKNYHFSKDSSEKLRSIILENESIEQNRYESTENIQVVL